jgi:hypothetical protein
MKRSRLVVEILVAAAFAAAACSTQKHTPMIPASELGPAASGLSGETATEKTPTTKPETTATTRATTDASQSQPTVELRPISVKAPALANVSIKVTNPGDKSGRRLLAFNVKAGDKQKVSYVINASFTAPGGDVTAFPTTVFAGETEVRSVTGTEVNYRFVASTVDVRVTANQVKSADLLRKQMQVLNGLTITGTVAATGAMGETEYSLSSAPPKAADVLKEMLPMFPTWMLMPTTPVGNGATWQVTRPFATNGVNLSVTHMCKLELTATTAKISATAEVTGANQDLGQGASMSNVKGSGTFSVQFDNKHLYGTQQGSVEPNFTISQDGQTAQVGMMFAPGFELPVQ